MKVCIDVQAAVAQGAGVGRYVACLVAHLAAQREDDELTAFCLDFRRRRQWTPPAAVGLRSIRWLPGRLVQQGWKRIGFPPFDALAGRADVYHFPNFIRPPLRRGSTVVTIHDLSFLHHPATTEERNLAYLTAHIGPTVDRSDAILADSETIATEIREQWPAAADRVVAVPLAVPPGLVRPDAAAAAAVRRALGLDRPYLLSVGTIEPRKNFAFLVEVFERLEGFDGDLAIAGRRGWKCEPILRRMAESPLRHRIRRIEPASDAELAALYEGAAAFVLPSLYEGFGLPPLEAMAVGTPAIVSDGGSLPEICGDAAQIVRGFDPEEWRTAIARVLGDETLRRDMAARGRTNAARFSWDDTARRTWAVYRAVARRPPRARSGGRR